MSGHALTAQIIELQSVLSSLDDPAFLREVDRAAEVLVAAATARLPILTCGNGGSAADAQHIATEIVGRFRRKHTPVPAVSLVSDAAVLTAWSNDEGYETVFSRQVEALGREGGVVWGLSTSGNSANVVAAFRAARDVGMTTIAMTGQGGGRLSDVADVLIAVPSGDTQHIQETHLCLYHYLCGVLEDAL